MLLSKVRRLEEEKLSLKALKHSGLTKIPLDLWKNNVCSAVLNTFWIVITGSTFCKASRMLTEII